MPQKASIVLRTSCQRKISGFNENSRDAPSSSGQSNNDFAIPLENDDDPDDPEDPQDPHHSGRRNIGPSLPSALNANANRRGEFLGVLAKI